MNQQNGAGDHRKVAFITSVTGQYGAYLAELSLEKGYEVHGVRRCETPVRELAREMVQTDLAGNGQRADC